MKRKLLLGTFFILSIGLLSAKQHDSTALPSNFSDSSLKIERIIKRNLVTLSPNPTTSGNVKVMANGINEEVHFYVFDVAGELMHQATLKGNDKHAINNLKKGIYTYDVFKNDEGVEQGKIIVK